MNGRTSVRQPARAGGRGRKGWGPWAAFRGQPRRLRIEMLEDRTLLAAVAFPVPLAGVDPVGSLIYTSSARAVIDSAGDSDHFSINLDDGQTVTVVVQPASSLQAQLDVVGPAGTSLASATAGAVGMEVVLQAVPTTGAGSYGIDVAGAAGTTGDYTVQLILGAAVEGEQHGGPANDTIDSAQDLDRTFVMLGPDGAQRGAVSAALDPDQAVDLGAGVNTSGNDTAPTLSADGLTLLFSSDRPGGAGGYDIYVATRSSVSESFGNVVALGPAVNTADNETGPALSADGLTLYFASNRADGLGDNDLYMATRPATFAPFDHVTNLGATVNTSANEANPSVSADGLALAFNSNRAGGLGRQDIYMATRDTASAPFTNVANAGPKVNSDSSEGAPSFSADGLSLLFHSNRTGGVGGMDFYFATRQAITGEWVSSKLLGDGINSADSDRSPSISFDGETLVFDSSRAGGEGKRDIYIAELTDSDWYRFSLAAGESAALALSPIGDDGQFVAFQQKTDGYTGTVDTYLAEAHPDMAPGMAQSVNIDGDDPGGSGMQTQALLRFDGIFGNGPGQIAAGDRILSARLELEVTDRGDFVRVHRMLQEWTDEDTWNHFGGNGIQADDVEAAREPDASMSPGGTGPISIDVTASLRAWQQDPAENLGWVMLPTGNDGVDLAAAESATPPRLVVDVSGASGQLELYDDAGRRLAFGTRSAGTVSRVIRDFVAPSAGTYLARIGGRARGAYQTVIMRNAAFETEPNDGLPPAAQDITLTGSVLGYAGPVPAATDGSSDAGASAENESDFFGVEVSAGDPLDIQTWIPGNGSGEFANELDVAAELYNPAGTMVASDPNGSIRHVATDNGTYAVRVLAENDTSGEYVLGVTGQSGAMSPFAVMATQPTDGAVFVRLPAQMEVRFDGAPLLTTLAASDLTVDGVPALGVSMLDGDTARFDLPGGFEVGPHTVAIAAGSVLDLRGAPIEPFSATFSVDQTAPRVVAASVADGDTIPAAVPTVLTLQMDELLRAANLDTSDVILRGATSGLWQPTALDYESSTSTLTLEYDPLPEDDFTLTLISRNGAFEDLAGNDLDGKPSSQLPSGDGVPGGDFVVHFSAEIGTAPMPLPLAAEAPLGALIYETEMGGVIGTDGDIDRLTIDLDDGQTVAVLVTPAGSLQPTVALWDRTGTPMGTATAAAAGDSVVLQALPASESGTYTIAVGETAATTGPYFVQVVLNAALEEEPYAEVTNDDLASAQGIESSFIALGPAGAERGAVVGSLPAPNVDRLGTDVNTTDADDAASLSADGLTLVFRSTRPGGMGGGDLYLATRASISEPFDDVVALGPSVNTASNETGPALSTDGLTLYFASNRPGGFGKHDLYMATRATLSDPFEQVTNLGAGVNSAANDNNPAVTTDGLTLLFNSNRPGGFGDQDLYMATRATVADTFGMVANLGGEVNSSDADSAPSVAANGLSLYFHSQRAGGAGGPDLYLATRMDVSVPFSDPVNLGKDVNSAEGERSPDISAGGNTLLFDKDGTGGEGDRDIFLATVPAADWYRFSLDEGASATLALSPIHANAVFELPVGPPAHGLTPAVGLLVQLDLYNAAGQLLVRGDAEADNASRVIHDFTAPEAADYFVRIAGWSGRPYQMVVTRGATFDTEINDSFAGAQNIGVTGAVLGHVRDTGHGMTTLAADEGSAAGSAIVPGALAGGSQDDWPVTPVLNGPIPVLRNVAGPDYTWYYRPDPTFAVGPEQVVAVVNSRLSIYEKNSGETLFWQDLPTLFSSVGARNTIYSSWALYDPDAQRFFVIGVDHASETKAHIFLAVSKTATPIDGTDWYKFRFNSTQIPPSGLGSGLHFPWLTKIGITHDAIWITGLYYRTGDGSGVYPGITAMEKAPFLDGAPGKILYEETFSGSAVFPMAQYGSGSTEYFAEAPYSGGSSIKIHAVTNVLTAPTRTTVRIPVLPYQQANDVPQRGGEKPAQTMGTYVVSGVWRDGSMWFAHAVKDAAGGGESAVRWYQVATNNFPQGTPTLIQSGNVDPGPGIHAWMPAIGVDGRGNMGIGFALGGPDRFYGAGFTGRLATDPAGTTALPLTEYVGGYAYYDRGDSDLTPWGYYSGLTIDPTDDATFWVLNEYANRSGSWSTQVASFQLEKPFDEDWYQFEVTAGDALVAETFTPGGDPLEFANSLDPAIELYDPTGQLVAADDNSAADGRNALLQYTALMSGSYRLHVAAVATAGEYLLRVSGPGGGQEVAANDFTRVQPLGSLVAVSAGNSGSLDGAGDARMFDFFVEGGERIAAIAMPDNPGATLQLSWTDGGPMVTASAAGAAVVLPPRAVASDGVDTISVSGDTATSFELAIYRNTSLEAEVGDSDEVNVLAIDDSFVALGSGRYAVIGTSRPPAPRGGTRGSDLSDLDQYALDLSGKAGQQIDIVLAGQGDADFATEVLELLAEDGATVLATASPAPLGDSPTNYDLGILGFRIPHDGRYMLRFSSIQAGQYGILVTTGPLVFDTEPNDQTTDLLRNIRGPAEALGFLDAAGSGQVLDGAHAGDADRDLYRIELGRGEVLTAGTLTPFDNPSARVPNSLNPELTVLDPLGVSVATDTDSFGGKNAIVHFMAVDAGMYTIRVSAQSGAGEYLLLTSVVPGMPPIGDVNGDGAVDGRDVEVFADILAAGEYNAAADTDGNGVVNGLDVRPLVAAVVGADPAGVATTAVASSLDVMRRVAARYDGPWLAGLPPQTERTPSPAYTARDDAVASIVAEHDAIRARVPDPSAAAIDRTGSSRRGRHAANRREHIWQKEHRWVKKTPLDSIDTIAADRARRHNGMIGTWQRRD